MAPHRVSEQHIGAFGPCAITFYAKYSFAEREILCNIFMCFTLYRRDNCELRRPMHDQFLISTVTW